MSFRSFRQDVPITDDMTMTEIIVEALRRAAVDPDVRTRTIEIRVEDLADAIDRGWLLLYDEAQERGRRAK